MALERAVHGIMLKDAASGVVRRGTLRRARHRASNLYYKCPLKNELGY